MKAKPIAPEPIVFEMRRLREARGLSQDELARKAGITHTTISRIETGKNHPSIYFVNIYLQVLGLKLKIVKQDESL